MANKDLLANGFWPIRNLVWSVKRDIKNQGKYSTFKFCLGQIGGWHTDGTCLISEGAKGD